MDRAPEIDATSDVADQPLEQWCQERLRAAEAHRTAAQIARFARDEDAVLRHVRAAVQEEAAAAAARFKSDS